MSDDDQTPEEARLESAVAGLREQVAMSKGLPPGSGRRLTGDDVEAISKDADDFAATLGLARERLDEPAPTRDENGALFATPGSFAGGQRGGYETVEPTMNDLLRSVLHGGKPSAERRREWR